MKKKNIIIILIIFMFFSFINLRSTNLLTRQLLFYAVAISLIYFYKNDIVSKNIRLLYIIFNALLLYLLLFGKEVNGSKAWITLGLFSFQPSEFMKIILIIYLSFIATKYEKYKLKCLLITIIPALLTFLEPDTGNVVFYFVTYFSILFYKEGSIKSMIKYGIALLCIFAFVLLTYLKFSNYFIEVFGYSVYYRVERIFSLINNDSYQLNRALIGIGSSHLFGTKNIVSIPYETTDFAFSYLVSNIGFIGAIIFLLFNAFVIYYFINCIRHNVGSKRLAMFSFVSMYIIQSSIHILMNIGLFPITGITLPFISYGGSSILSYAIMLAILSKDSYSMADSMDMEQDYNRLVSVLKGQLLQLRQGHLKEME